MSDTPRTDEAEMDLFGFSELATFARTLERALAMRDKFLRQLIEDCRNGCYPTEIAFKAIERELGEK